MVVLPSSFTGRSRYMHERTQDAMTYVRHFGRPDLFITFTCNPKWPEIVDLLNHGQKSHEWQKRGLPHVHILLWLEDKIRPESIDKVVCAELPDSNLDHALYEIIRKTVIHGPCGESTKFPPYRRRSLEDGGTVTQIEENNVDNWWVVPVLSRTFNAHINVEYCNSVKSIKYICKYVNKGTGQAIFSVEDLDEVTRYESSRYISSSEAVWRIL
ncbi:ATP-dependent DNA helicase [Trichonephila clavata]|uniref:ATP-dependent DNA helicase n=1 Tax=Trichonephila clavata TaxID=2740835 RepID=A0A8X6HRX2_TRICU|nr:ATP-dependent DNA helicase [Trichonephila clavata]